MTLNSSRLLIGQGLQALIASVMNGANPLFPLCKLGFVFDPTPYSSFVEITFHQAKSAPAGSGGQQIGWRIEDGPLWLITGGWEYEADSDAAEINMLAAQDILVPFLHTHYQVPNPNNPSIAIASLYHLTEWEQTERARRPMNFPNGRAYRLWDIFIGTKQQYNVTIVNP
jgi:hypothetical protein